MTSHISKSFQIALATLALVPLSLALNLSPVRAQVPNALGDIIALTQKIARNPLQLVAESTDKTADTDTSTAREQSMEYVKSGYAAEEAGNAELALANYYTAMKVDPSNGYAFLLAGRLIGNNETGIECVKMAAKLFAAEHDRQGYKLAYELLQAAN